MPAYVRYLVQGLSSSYVVDVLDENYIRSESRKVVQQSSMAARMKHDPTGAIATNLAVQVRRDRIRVM